jgi:hypothetical protein
VRRNAGRVYSRSALLAKPLLSVTSVFSVVPIALLYERRMSGISVTGR